MNSNWRNRPTSIDIYPDDLDYIISIDENGTSNLKPVINAKSANKQLVDSEKHFLITACKIDMRNFDSIKTSVMTLKHKYWNKALYTYNGQKKRVCFHSKEIRERKGAFSNNQINYNEFITDLSSMIDSLPITLYCAHINKEKLVNQYVSPIEPYDLCMTFLLERLMIDIPDDKKCIIILESRGKKEDQKLLSHIVTILKRGTPYFSEMSFKKIIGVYFNKKWCELKNDQMSYWQLELADLCSYPLYKFFAHNKIDKALEIIRPKISCYPNIFGKGVKSFP